MERAIKRDESKAETIQNIIASQVDRQTRLNYADDVIENNLPLEENAINLAHQVAKLHHRYLDLAKQEEKK